mmetsp:Transcript_25070/g.78149  ORF Transcript_25070/g.78149 Transcript_25070/m.78149 type:complete len:237 (-) Transcript_25070:36-746(-)
MHSGHVHLRTSHDLMQSWWKRCRQGSWTSISPASQSSAQMAHSSSSASSSAVTATRGIASRVSRTRAAISRSCARLAATGSGVFHRSGCARALTIMAWSSMANRLRSHSSSKLPPAPPPLPPPPPSPMPCTLPLPASTQCEGRSSLSATSTKSPPHRGHSRPRDGTAPSLSISNACLQEWQKWRVRCPGSGRCGSRETCTSWRARWRVTPSRALKEGGGMDAPAPMALRLSPARKW